MQRHVLSILVENQAGVLSRVAGLFSRRGFNIDSLSVGVTQSPELSRITVVTTAEDHVIRQMIKQVEKLIDVVEVVELKAEDAVYRELALLKIKVTPGTRTEIVGTVDIFRANIVDVSYESITVEITGDQGKIDAFIELMRPYGLIEMVRTGLTALQRGQSGIQGEAQQSLPVAAVASQAACTA